MIKTLDVTDLKQTGLELADEIENMFNDTQRLIVQPYPSELLMTRKQFNDLTATTGNIHEMTPGEEWRMWLTKEGYVMEVRVK